MWFNKQKGWKMFFDGSQIPIKEGREMYVTALQILDFNGQGQP